VGLSTVKEFEKGERKTIAATAEAMRRAIEDAGIRLVFDETGKATGIALADAAGSLSSSGGSSFSSRVSSPWGGSAGSMTMPTLA